ncbi:transposase [Paraburkholderia heleia]|uniref:transposase n=1 Tax=Paraburkholderia heleia TaxID=634127 RepID=UPI002AB72E65|nr:transposase [Paraburkholderia heleia]
MGKLNLCETDGEELMSMQRGRTMVVSQVRRAQFIFLLDERASRAAIMGGISLRCALRGKCASPVSVWRTCTVDIQSGRHDLTWRALKPECATTRPAARKEIHLIYNNVSSRKTDAVQILLADHPKVSTHYTPTYSPWLNQIENWFFPHPARRHCTWRIYLHQGSRQKLMRYIRQYNKQALPMKLKYFDPSWRIRCNSSGSTD